MNKPNQPKFDNVNYQKDYYKKHSELLKERRRQRYQRTQKRTAQKSLAFEHSLYNAASIKVLMSLKDYTEYSREKKKLWADVVWTLKDIAENINFADIVQLQKLELLIGKLVRDYYETAKAESKRLESNWTSLNTEEQNRLIRYWGMEKARQEKALASKLESLEWRGEYFEKEIERAKFHEERGKVNCECWQCQQQIEAQAERSRELEEFYEEKEEKIECANCGKKVKPSQWNEEADTCKKCVKEFED